ncbi:MAG: hypothetical protein AB1641_09930 [Thermodesulfobacteriota bacterium]
MATWPATLPQELEVRGFKEEFPNALLRTPMDSGPPKQRQRFTAAPTPITGQQTLTTAQRATLYTFFVDTLGHGADVFDWVHPVTGAACEFRFKAPPSLTPLGQDSWIASYELEIMP